jgi:uncharacterized protein (TIGR03435 family)
MAVMPLFSQTFEVASIRPAAPGVREGISIQPGGRFVASSASLKLLIALAWGLPPFQMSGGERWTADERWSIEAKSSDLTEIPAWSLPYIPQAIAVRLQGLLEDRFGLKTHKQVQELRVYALGIGKGGSKMIPADGASQAGVRAGPGVISGSAVGMSQLVLLLERLLDRPVIDKTELTGKFSVSLQFAPQGADSADPSLFTAVQEQLGLKLETGRESMEILFIDFAHRPTEN